MCVEDDTPVAEARCLVLERARRADQRLATDDDDTSEGDAKRRHADTRASRAASLRSAALCQSTAGMPTMRSMVGRYASDGRRWPESQRLIVNRLTPSRSAAWLSERLRDWIQSARRRRVVMLRRVPRGAAECQQLTRGNAYVRGAGMATKSDVEAVLQLDRLRLTQPDETGWLHTITVDGDVVTVRVATDECGCPPSDEDDDLPRERCPLPDPASRLAEWLG